MPSDQIIIFLVITILSIVQSVFGIGILIFGTPLLLLLGHSFPTALSFLLPASLAISLLQVLTFQGQKPAISPYLYTLCLPAIALGLWITDTTLPTAFSHYLIGAILISSGLLRLRRPLQDQLKPWLSKHMAVYHTVMGVVHGLTNLGGALLTVLASWAHEDKAYIRYMVAYYYLFFSVAQIFVLYVIIQFPAMFSINLISAIIAVLTYQLIGNKIFARANNDAYQVALNFFIVV